MRKLFKFRYLLPLLLLTGGLLFFPASWYLEKSIADSLDLDQIRSNIIARTEQQTGLSMSAQGIQFDLYRGIVLHGVRLNQEASETGTEDINLFYIEDLIVSYSIVNYLRGQAPLTSIRLRGGSWYLGSIERERWSSIFKQLMQIDRKDPSQIASSASHSDKSLPDLVDKTGRPLFIKSPVLQLENIQLDMQNLQADLFSTNIQNLQIRLNLQATRVEQRFELLMELNARSRDRENTNVKARGFWQTDNRGRLRFELKEIPSSLLLDTIAATSGLPFGNTLEDRQLWVRGGHFSGRGSLESYGPGLGMDIQGKFSDISYDVGTGGTPFMHLPPGNVKVHYNAGWLYEAGDHSFVDFELEQNGLDLSVHFKDIPPEQRQADSDSETGGRTQEAHLNIEALMQLSDEEGPRLTDLAHQGQIKFSLKLPIRARRGTDRPSLKIDINDLHFKSGASSKVQSSSDDQISSEDFIIKTATIKNKPTQDDSDSFIITARGNGLSCTYDINGNGDLNVYQTPRATNRFHVNQDIDLNLDLKNCNYQHLIQFFTQHHFKITYNGSRQDARRAEDKGPLWQEQFQQSDFYTTYIRNTEYNIEIRMKDLKDGGGLATDLLFNGYLRNGQMQLKLSDYDCQQCRMEFDYKLSLQRYIPGHDLSFYISNDHNSMTVPFLTGHDLAPSAYKLRYFMAGDGWLAGDILHRTWSRLNLEATDVRIKKKRLRQLLSYGSGQKLPEYHFADFDLVVGTEGPRVQYRISAPLLNGRVKSDGNFKTGRDGYGRVQFYNERGGLGREIRLHHKPDLSWTPTF